MTSECQQIQPACAHTFQEITGHYYALHQTTVQLQRDISAVRKAVVGDGNRDSLAARVEHLEAVSDTKQQVGDKFWKIFGVAAAVAAVVVAVIK